MSLSARLGGSFSYPFTADRVCFLFFHNKKKILFSLQSPRTTRLLLEVCRTNWPGFHTCFKDEGTLHLLPSIFFFFSSEGEISSCYNHLQYDEGELKDPVRKIHFNA